MALCVPSLHLNSGLPMLFATESAKTSNGASRPWAETSEVRSKINVISCKFSQLVYQGWSMTSCTLTRSEIILSYAEEVENQGDPGAAPGAVLELSMWWEDSVPAGWMTEDSGF